MPYVDHRYVPETEWDHPSHNEDWEQKYAPWRYRGDPVGELGGLAPKEARERLVALGADIAKVLNDAWVYWNLAEHLKVAELAAPTRLDDVAGWAVDRMGIFDMRSAQLTEEDGGPPDPTNSRPFRRVLNYLLEKLGDVKEFLSRGAEAFIALIRRVAENTTTGVTVAISTPWPSFEVGFQVDVELGSFVRDALRDFESQLFKLRL